MPTRRRFALCTLTVALSVSAICAAPAHAENACDAVYQAAINAIQTPHHLYSTVTTTHTSKPTSTETILAGGVTYLKMNDKWQRSPMSPRDMLKAAQEKIKARPDTCTVVGDQIKDGQEATLYQVHNNHVDVNQQVWIAKSSGRLVHVMMDLSGGSGADVRYEYTNVQPPAGVN